MNYYNYPVKPTLSTKEMVYDPKFGYLEADKLIRKRVRRDVSGLSLAAISMLLISVLFGVVIGPFLIVSNAYGSDFKISTDIFYAMSCALVVLGTGLPFFLYLVITRPKDISSFLRFEKVGFSRSFMYIFAGGALCLLSNFPAQWVTYIVESMGFNVSSPSTPTATDPLSMALYFFSVAVLPPLFEEFAFRGVLLSTLRKYGDVFAIITSSIIFGFMHMNITSIPFAVLAGAVMGFAYVKTGNLWVSIGIHFANNAVAVILDLLSSNVQSPMSDLIGNLIFYVFIIIGIVFLVLLIVKKEISLPKRKAEIQSSPGNLALGTISNPGFIIAIGVCGIYTLMDLLGVLNF